MNLGRIGHYFVPNGRPDGDLAVGGTPVPGGTCRTALVTGHEDYGGANPNAVNLTVFEHDGDPYDTRVNVPVYYNRGEVHSNEDHSFHLNADCPWAR